MKILSQLPFAIIKTNFGDHHSMIILSTRDTHHKNIPPIQARK
jgi:hypothetical protein